MFRRKRLQLKRQYNPNTTYGSNTNPGEIDAKDIKEWRDKRNEADVYAGWYHFKGEYTGWQSVGIQAHNESSSGDYVLGTTFFTMEIWKKGQITIFIWEESKAAMQICGSKEQVLYMHMMLK